MADLRTFTCGDLAACGISGMEKHDLDAQVWAREDVCCPCCVAPSPGMSFRLHSRLSLPSGPWDDPQQCCSRTVHIRGALRLELCCLCDGRVASIDALFAEVCEVLPDEASDEMERGVAA